MKIKTTTKQQTEKNKKSIGHTYREWDMCISTCKKIKENKKSIETKVEIIYAYKCTYKNLYIYEYIYIIFIHIYIIHPDKTPWGQKTSKTPYNLFCVDHPLLAMGPVLAWFVCPVRLY